MDFAEDVVGDGESAIGRLGIASRKKWTEESRAATGAPDKAGTGPGSLDRVSRNTWRDSNLRFRPCETILAESSEGGSTCQAGIIHLNDQLLPTRDSL